MFQYNWQKRVVAAMPLIALVIYLFIGFQFNLWHPGWVVFVLVPLTPFLVGLKQIRITFPLVVLVIYFILGAFGFWHPGWLVFLLILIQNILFPPKSISKYIKKETKPTKQHKDYMDAEIDE